LRKIKVTMHKVKHGVEIAGLLSLCVDSLPMARDPNIPDAFDVFTLVILRRPPDAPQMSEPDLDALQARHLAYRADLRRQGLVVVNGPLVEQSDESLRGLSIFACGLDEAARLSDGDPSVQAGRLAYDLMEWWVAAGTLAFPEANGPVGDRREMPDD
jgi:YCII-related domain-containing protein